MTSMLGSWFGQKGSVDASTEGTTPRPSVGSPADHQPHRLSGDKAPKRAFPTAFNTPHDTILSDLHGTSARPDPLPTRSRPASFRSDLPVSPDPDPPEGGPTRENPSPFPLRSDQNLLGVTPSNTLLTPIPDAFSSDLLLDPFDGMTLGVLLSHEASKSNEEERSPSPFFPNSFDAGQTGPRSVGTEAVWNNLSRILDLQSQISKKHLEMENIGAAKGSDAKKKVHKLSVKSTSEVHNFASHSTPALGLNNDTPVIPTGLNPPGRQRATSVISMVSSDNENESEEDVNVPNEEAEKTRIREDEFAKLASQFEGRKDAINDIMGKLDELSKALSELHNIPSPNIEFCSPRQSANSPPNSGAEADPAKEDNSQQTGPASQSNPPITTRASQGISSQSTVLLQSHPSSTATAEKAEPVIPKPVSEKAKALNSTIPMVLINSQDPQVALYDSPASIEGRMLPPI